MPSSHRLRRCRGPRAKHCTGHEAVGCTLLLPARALPGWPNEVPLPVDPVWKKDYAASVRRLIRDGADAPPDDLQRARSASEAFLHQRLNTLTETGGLFRLNAKLPIPFDGWSEMEIGRFSAELKIAIEIDGPQQLSDPAAYRRDRRKDALLQENGCLVLRFLAEDLGKHLNATLDAILRAIVHRRRTPR
jgi:very-short-patch-repair endonuclease